MWLARSRLGRVDKIRATRYLIDILTNCAYALNVPQCADRQLNSATPIGLRLLGSLVAGFIEVISMALAVTFFTGADQTTGKVYGGVLSRLSVTLTATSVDIVPIPLGATVVRIKAGEPCYVTNSGAASSTNGIELAANEVIDLSVYKTLAARTV
jgi:hypothetical protein